uniref:Putative secreted peptide n=1 Tax=Anopheles braziliensis TaxID=58242 RepID=A0A2M3ZNW6_9DIPT
MRPSINIAACFLPVYSFTAFSSLISVTSVEAFNVSEDVLLSIEIKDLMLAAFSAPRFSWDQSGTTMCKRFAS